MLEGLVVKLAETPWSIALHESLYMYAITESTHVMSIMLFVGTIAMVDLRLLGISYNKVPVSQMLSRMLPWTVAGFVLLVITGAMLFLAIPIRTYHSIWFRLKCLMILIAAVNIAIFTFKVERDKAAWDMGPVPRKSKICAVIKNPEMTKNTSTPMKPPRILDGNAWYPTTSSTATARKPSMSGR